MTREALADLARRAVQVFTAALVVELAAGDLVASLSRVEFWQDLAGAAIIAVLAEALGLASARFGHHGGGEARPPDT